MKQIIVLILFTLTLASCGSKNLVNDLAISNPVNSEINISKVTDDKVPVTINPGRFTEETVTYRLPRVVQGTYAVSDFGSFIDNFIAYDYSGNEMATTKVDDNSWTISNAKDLDKVAYLVNDTYDIESSGKTPFSPSGTNIDPRNYVLNLHGFIGYFDSLKNNQYRLDVIAPADFVRTSALQSSGMTTSEDGKNATSHYSAPRYFDITDNPMMYGELDVEEFKVGDITIVLSVYSPNKVHSAAKIKEVAYRMMEAQKEYLGDINSTPRYDIYLYLADQGENAPKGFGALEHHTSTVVVLPENMPFEALEESMIDVVAHEFFHIVTPLSVHSEDVHYFDYNKPTFSKHLWMYEGVTEYFATLFQVDQNLVSEDEFYTKILGKINAAANMDDTMSFTEMSENVLDEPYAPQYFNVYQKGALIGMCIDILMREESNGDRGILSLMKELTNKYGKNMPFDDDSIVEEITKMTYPSVGEFLLKHVVGVNGKTEPIDYNLFFAKAGLENGEAKVKANYIMNNGVPIVSGSPDKGIFFTEAVSANSFWAGEGVKPNDIIKVINGTEVTLQNANSIFQEVFTWTEGKVINVKLERDGKEIVIDTEASQPYTMGKTLMANPNATEKQNNLRKAWLKG